MKPVATPVRIVLPILAALFATRVALAAPPAGGYVKIWEDRFDAASLNSANWTVGLKDPGTNHMVPGAAGQYRLNTSYADYITAEDVVVQGGSLLLKAQKRNYTGTNPSGSFQYTSGWVMSMHKVHFNKGYVEFRAKFPSGDKVWPALWLIAEDRVWGPEWDMWEYFGWRSDVGYDNMGMHLCYDEYPNEKWSTAWIKPFDTNYDCETWHTYGFEWTATYAKWSIDGTVVRTLNNTIGASWPNEEMYFVLNNGVKSDSPDTTTWPNQVEIDYVEVWQIPSGPTVNLSVNKTSIAEAAGSATVTATLSAVQVSPVTVNLAYTGTATGSGTDYTASATSIVIPAGSTTGTVTLTAVQDGTAESGETIIVDISSVTGAAENGTQQVSVLIDDDDTVVNMTHWWKLDGNANDFVGTLHGTHTGTAVWATGVSGQALQSNASHSTTFGVDGAVLSGTSNYTMSLWFKTPDVTLERSLWSKHDGTWDTGYPMIALSLKADGRLDLWGRKDVNWAYGQILSNTTGLDDNAWHHVVVTRTSGITRMYIDGVLDNSDTGNQFNYAVNTAYTLRIAEASYDGMIDDVRTYSGALNATAVQNLYSQFITVSVSATDANAAETGSDTGTFTFTRTGGTSGSLTVYYTVGGTATAGSDYTSIGSSVTFSSGQASVTKTVTPIDDTTAESAETVNVTITADAAYTIATSSATVTIATSDGYSIPTWIVAGQSNAEGYGITSDPVPGLAPQTTLAGISRSDLNTTHSNVRFYQGVNDYNSAADSAGLAMSAKASWHAMTPYEGLAYDWGAGRGGESGRRFGPELAFGYEMQRRLGTEIAIIKFARGSTSLASGTSLLGDGSYNDYDPSDSRANQYDKLVTTISNAVTNLPAGEVLRLRGVLWMQGEGDANATMSANYEANLTEFITALRSQLATIASSSGGRLVPETTWGNLKFYLGTIATPGTDGNTVRNAQAAVAAADSNVFTVNGATGITMMTTDDWGYGGLHYDTAGQVTLGERFYGAVNSAFDAYETWQLDYQMYSNAGSSDDYDGDGISNLLEYACNGNPTQKGGVSGLQNTSVTAGYFQLTHTQRSPSDPSLVYTLETNSTLTGSWSQVTNAAYVGETAAVNGYKTVTYQIPRSGAVRFYRLKVAK